MREEGRHEIEVHVGGICIRDNNGDLEVLAAKRSDDRELYPGKWECGGGSIKPGESFQEAIKRQHKEELGIDSNVIMPLGFYNIKTDKIPQKIIPGLYILCEASGEAKVDGKEIVECKWISVEKIADIDFIPGMIEQIKKSAEVFKKLTIVYVPCKDEEEAKNIGDSLIGKHLAACINIIPISSLYNWQGKRCEENEAVMIAKSISSKLEQIEEDIKKLHSYERPCILKFKADANPEYIEWLKDEVKKG